MKPKIPLQVQSYNDGIASIQKVKNIAPEGRLPVYITEPKGKLPYEERTVGMGRFWTASQENTKIERLLRFPRKDTVVRDDQVIPTDGKPYTIVQVQYPPDVSPPSMDLSLERVEVAYEPV
jgi:hypothetical protein